MPSSAGRFPARLGVNSESLDFISWFILEMRAEDSYAANDTSG
jgi:hypothetical protein